MRLRWPLDELGTFLLLVTALAVVTLYLPHGFNPEVVVVHEAFASASAAQNASAVAPFLSFSSLASIFDSVAKVLTGGWILYVIYRIVRWRRRHGKGSPGLPYRNMGSFQSGFPGGM